MIKTIERLEKQKEKTPSPTGSYGKRCLDKKENIIEIAKQYNIQTKDKTHEQLCELTAIAIQLDNINPEDFEKLSLQDLRKMFFEITGRIDKSLKNTYMLDYIYQLAQNYLDSVKPIEKCLRKTQKQVETISKSAGINVSGKSKQDLCEEYVSVANASTSTPTFDRMVEPKQNDYFPTNSQPNSLLTDDLSNHDINPILVIDNVIQDKDVADEIIERVYESLDDKAPDDQVISDAVINAVNSTRADNLISKKEAEKIIQNVTVVKKNRTITRKQDIEELLKELREPHARVSELQQVQTKVFELLGLIH
jgi:hypothetical protein